MQFTTNIGTVDRVLRIIVGVALIVMALTGVFSPWGWIGIVPLVTAFLKFCPAYSLFGIKTSRNA